MDLHNSVKYSRGLSPVAAVTNDTAFVSQIADTSGMSHTEFVILTGTNSDADATFTVLVEDGDNSALSDNAAVADANLLGLEAATITSGASNGAGANFGYADDNKVTKIGYRGNKRYVRVTITPANNTGNVFIAGVWAQVPKGAAATSQIV